MKHYTYVRKKGEKLIDYMGRFLNEHGVYDDCVVTYALANYVTDELGNKTEHIVSVGNTLVRVEYTKGDMYRMYEDFDEGEDILYIYGYTPISEVIMTRGVV